MGPRHPPPFRHVPVSLTAFEVPRILCGMDNAEHMQKPGIVPLKPGTKVAEVRMCIRAVFVAIVAGGVPAMMLLVALADALSHGSFGFGLRDLAIAVVLFVPLGMAHELLHALAALVHGRLRPRDLRIGVDWKAGALICGMKVPIRVRTARVVLLAPLVVTGPVMLGLLLLYPSDVTALLAAFMILGCAMDVAMICRLGRFDGNLLFVDRPSEPGFDIYTPESPT